MKRKVTCFFTGILVVMALGVLGICAQQETVISTPLELTLTPQSYQALRVLCAADIAGQSARCARISRLIAQLLSSGGQIDVHMRSMAMPTTKSQMHELAQQGFPLAIFISCDEHECSWRLYDMLVVQLIHGRKTSLVGLSDQECAIHSAGQLQQEIMSQLHSFDSLIAACRQMPSGRRTQKELCLVHPFFSRDDFPVRVLVNKGHNFAPRWHKTRPVIYYAHHTPTNIRLMSIDAGKQVHIITDFDGQNLTPAFAPDGKIVMALSIKNFVQLFLYHFDEQTKKSKFTQLTYEKGDCISPSFITHDTLVFSKVDEHNQPELGIFTLSTKKVKWLPVGHAMCPMASPDGNLIAYCKKVGGVGQVCIYELSTGKERQLTHDSGYKDECSWSPCGNYITCSVESGTKSRIAIIPVATGHVQFITPANEHWSSPCWSPQLVLPFAFK